MKRRSMNLGIGTMAAAATLALGCGDDGSGGSGGTTGNGPGSADDDDASVTLPVTSASAGDDGVGDTDMGSSSGGMGTTEGPDPDSSGSGSGSDASSSSAGASEESSSSGGAAAVTIDWCRLQSPASVDVAVDEAFTVYGRVYVEGVTDQSVNNDPYPTLVAEIGWGDDGSDPAAAAWTWISATPNPGWDGTTFGEPNNDEYMADVSIDTAGTWDYAIRFSGDGGTEWVYCDLDDLLTGGYTADQAGDATVSPP